MAIAARSASERYHLPTILDAGAGVESCRGMPRSVDPFGGTR